MRAFKPRLSLTLFLALLLALSPSAQAREEERQIVIRDAEIENTLKSWLTPLARAAGIEPDNIHLVIVQSPKINAFVAGGANLFIYTGLIDKTDSPGEMIGVMAHELGHIAGGHLIAGRAAMERASFESILGAALGLGAALATGNGNAAVAGMGLGSTVAMRNFLSFSRAQESSADQAALRFMAGAHLSPNGFVSFLGKLEGQELLPASEQSEYTRTHPLSRDRIQAVEGKAVESPYKNEVVPAAWSDQYARMKAKLLAFINPGQVPWTYDDSDHTIPARYARAIAAYRQNKVSEALSEMDSLIKDEPQNPYFQELKGQALMEFGRVPEAVAYYKRAVAGAPNSGLIRIAYAHALLESGGGANAEKQAAGELERALRDEPRSTEAHRLLATAYGSLGQENPAKIELAEEALLQRRLEAAEALSKAVLASAPKNSRESIRARDILDQVASAKKKDD